MSYGLREKVLSDKVEILTVLLKKIYPILLDIRGQYSDVDEIIKKIEVFTGVNND